MTTITDKALALYVQARTTSVRDMLRDEDGQVAAEYMGLVALAAFIIFALITTTDIDGDIANAVDRLVGNIANGTEPSGGGGGGGGGGGAQ